MDAARDDALATRARRWLHDFFERTPRLGWLNEPDLPWSRRQSRADIACLSTIVATAILGSVWGAFGPAILAASPTVAAALGDRVGFVLMGSMDSAHPRWWTFALVMLAGAVMKVKFTWVTWWAGRLWGREVFDVLVRDKSDRVRRNYARFWDWAERFGSTFLALSVTPAPVPGRPVHAAVGAARMSLARFLVVMSVTAGVVNGAYYALGWWLGPQAMGFVNAYVRRWLPLMTGVALAALAVGALAIIVQQRRRTPAREPGTIDA